MSEHARPIKAQMDDSIFYLVVGGFVIKYIGEHNMEHLISCIPKKSSIIGLDWRITLWSKFG